MESREISRQSKRDINSRRILIIVSHTSLEDEEQFTQAFSGFVQEI